MSKPVFDKSKKYGEVHGHSDMFPGARYEQNGVVFNAQFRAISDAPATAEVPSPPDESNDSAEENSQVVKLKLELLAAESEVEDSPTPAKKAKVTKLKKQIETTINLLHLQEEQA